MFLIPGTLGCHLSCVRGEVEGAPSGGGVRLKGMSSGRGYKLRLSSGRGFELRLFSGRRYQVEESD